MIESILSHCTYTFFLIISALQIAERLTHCHLYPELNLLLNPFIFPQKKKIFLLNFATLNNLLALLKQYILQSLSIV